ncbi:MAG: B12-binding domain-containing radical SAM protein [Lachnospiraceae bacterium]|nr:B12-binding domain-containing radical SAM protein [Lachnospiraceae bacterium]
MKFVLAAIGSKYIHCNLAVHSLRAYAAAGGLGDSVEVAEYTINQNVEDILADLYRRRPDAVGFSCYIWNISMVQRLAADLHQILPRTHIWLGGPEVSFEPETWFQKMPFLAGIMVGEGEETFLQLMKYYEGREETALHDIPGIVWSAPLQEPEEKTSGQQLEKSEYRFLPEQILQVYGNPPRQPMDLSQVPFVYDHMEGDASHKIVYYESSRGCPFSCSYCLSSIDKKLRFRDWSLVERELAYFLEKKVPQVKFVDRTFNCSHAHAQRIWRYIKDHDNGVTNFHFEVSADILNEEELELLTGMRPGLVQLEIGVQSVNPQTLQEIRRTMDLSKLAANVSRLREASNIHLHLDLIAGLPWEDYDSFHRSFDWVYGLRPENLQLGFLKVLRGTRMYEKREEYGLTYSSQPPYEVLKTRWISYKELCHLKKVEKVLEIYYNSGQFPTTMEYLGRCYDSAFTMYEDLACYYEIHGLFDRQLSRQERVSVLWDFLQGGAKCVDSCKNEEEFDKNYEKVKDCGVAWRDILVYDYYLRENAKVRPAWAPEQREHWQSITDWYAAYGSTCQRLAAYAGSTYRQLLHTTHAEILSRDFLQNGQKCMILFDYGHRDPLTGNAFTWEAVEWREGRQ